jgi:hypothetical protein
MMTYIRKKLYEPYDINKLSEQGICWLIVYIQGGAETIRRFKFSAMPTFV